MATENGSSKSFTAEQLIKEAEAEVRKCEGEKVKKELKELYKRRMTAAQVLASIEREIELEEARIREIYG